MKNVNPSTARSGKLASSPNGLSFAGIHLSGPSAHRTAVAVLAGDPLLEPLRIVRVYEKIGGFGSLFSDDRLVDILTVTPLTGEVFVDCPLSLPPCVSCSRPTCPGVVKCDELSVAYMLALSGRIKSKRAQKLRPLNPQNQRLWDAYTTSRRGAQRSEPTFSPNLAPLVTRARVLQRRLNFLPKPITLLETSIPLVLGRIAHLIGADPRLAQDYRSFELGLATRMRVFEEMVDRGWFVPDEEAVREDSVIYSVEGFQALIAAWVAALHHRGLADRCPGDYVASEGWVHRPELEVPMRSSVKDQTIGR